MSFVITMIVGLLSGTTASLGLGGGFVLMLYLVGIANTPQFEAQGINLLFFIPIAALSIYFHKKNGLIEKSPILLSIIFGIIGVFIGFFIAKNISTNLLSKLFAGLILIVGAKELFFQKKDE